MDKQHSLLPGQHKGKIQEQQRLAGSCSPGDTCCRRRRIRAVLLQECKDPLSEIKLLIGEEILPLQELLRRGDRGDQILRRLEEEIDPVRKEMTQRLFPENRDQFRALTCPQIALLIQEIELIGFHHIGKRIDRACDMRQIVAVLLQLLFDPLLPDHLTLQFDIQDAAAILRDLEQVELLADMFNHIGEIKSIQKGHPAARTLERVCRKVRGDPVRKRPQRCRLMRTDLLAVLSAGQGMVEHGNGSCLVRSRQKKQIHSFHWIPQSLRLRSSIFCRNSGP